jgi:hypothetical protein
MRLAIWIVGLTALATSLDSAYGGFYGRAIARMLTDMANGFGLGWVGLRGCVQSDIPRARVSHPSPSPTFSGTWRRSIVHAIVTKLSDW